MDMSSLPGSPVSLITQAQQSLMCQDCVVEVRPDRGRTCVDHGAYLLNFKQCAACGVRGRLVEAARESEVVEEDDENDLYLTETTFNRT